MIYKVAPTELDFRQNNIATIWSCLQHFEENINEWILNKKADVNSVRNNIAPS